ncbi:transcriptional regulator [Microbacterium sp. KR10-403]|uniref:transcriptional regulator n=1 Tax=Microbacterium sp. KR10-403 TaxID=3158581 RepID=UPI0032E4367D
MSSPWSSPRGVHPDASRLLIERAHEEFITGNPADPRVGDVRAVVRDSWRRSLDSLVGVESLAPIRLTPEELEALRRTHPLAGVVDMIRELLMPGDVAESGVVVAVGDAAGRLLWVEGDRHVRALTGDMGFVPGADWSEDAVGTAAPGTALRLGSGVQIRGAEHFNRLVQPWSCTAAPVYDPETRGILGVIDVTGGDEVVTPQAKLLVDATARAVESELLLARLRERAERPTAARAPSRPAPAGATLRVLGRDRAELDRAGTAHELTLRHAELLLMLATHPEGLNGDALADLVYERTESPVTVRAEMARLRKALGPLGIELQSQPYRLGGRVETDAQQVLSLLDRGAHRVALASYPGDVLPGSLAPGVAEFRESVRTALRETLLAEASVDVLLAFTDGPVGRDDVQALQLCLRMLPPRSPRRAGIVARLEKLEA